MNDIGELKEPGSLDPKRSDRMADVSIFRKGAEWALCDEAAKPSEPPEAEVLGAGFFNEQWLLP